MQRQKDYKQKEKLFQKIGFAFEKEGSYKGNAFIGKFNGKRVLLKLNDLQERGRAAWFFRNKIFYRFLRNSNLKIKDHIPKLYSVGKEGSLSYMVFEHIGGRALGRSEPTRDYFGGKEELVRVLEILRLWQEASVEFCRTRKSLFVNVDIDEIGGKLKNNFSNEWVTNKFLKALGEEGKARLFSFKEKFERAREVFKREGRHLVHRDFRPQNFIIGGDRIYLIDFDFLGYGSRVFDFLTFWGFLYKYDNLRKFFIGKFLDKFKLTKEEKEIFKLEKLYFLFLEASELYKKERDGAKVKESALGKWQKKTLGDLAVEFDIA